MSEPLSEDLVARLRNALVTRTWVNLPEDIREAADEIEKLRNEIGRLRMELEETQECYDDALRALR